MPGSFATPLVLPLAQPTDRTIVGGKAAGLSVLVRAGFQVPPGLCLTTWAYGEALAAAGLDAAREWAEVQTLDALKRPERLRWVRDRLITGGLPSSVAQALEDALPALQTSSPPMPDRESTSWAVRSSAVDEDSLGSSYPGLYHTTLGASLEQLPMAITACWASLWSEQATAYAERMRHTRVPAMAVLIQPLLAPRAAGVAYSCHPLTSDPTVVVINAVFGLGEPLVGGHITPDQYIVRDSVVLTREITDKAFRHVYSQCRGGLEIELLPLDQRSQAVLTDPEILLLARIVRQIEQAASYAVDIEWALDDRFWLLQARPALSLRPLSIKPTVTSGLSDWPSDCTWSRANFMETLPELPSPLSLTFVRRFMETNIVNHYRRLGCQIPSGVSSVRTISGRPYINVTLFQSLMAQLGGDPAVVREQMGGEASPSPHIATLITARLPPLQLLRALCRLQAQIWHAGLTAPRWFARLTELAERQWDRSVEHLSEQQLLERIEDITARLQQHDLTFAIVSGVSQAIYAISATLRRRLTNWRPIFNAATQGFGTIISAKQISWLQELGEGAAQEPTVRRFFTEEPWRPSEFRTMLEGSRFMAGFQDFLREFGHRAVGESDVMSARFVETPEYLLEIIRHHLQTSLASRVDPRMTAQPPGTAASQQAATRTKALAEIHRAFGVRLHERLWFLGWYRVLGRFLALREANRHTLMRYVAAVRHVLQLVGNKLVERGLIDSAQDLFYLTDDELHSLVKGSPSPGGTTWPALVRIRRNDHQRQATLAVPYTVWSGQNVALSRSRQTVQPGNGEPLCGLALSAGIVEGPVRLVLTPADLQRIEPGDILVAPALDPGMAPAFGLAGGLVVEIGGLLSHGAIIAREYGIPAVSNVAGATIRLKAGEWVRLDADRGEIWRCGSSR